MAPIPPISAIPAQPALKKEQRNRLKAKPSPFSNQLKRKQPNTDSFSSHADVV